MPRAPGARARRAVAARSRSRSCTARPSRRTSCSVCARCPTLDPDRYALTVVNQALGGGMSSRLFQEVREERGLAYSVYSYRAAFDDAGYLAIYAGTAPERVQETLDVIETELDRLVARRPPGRRARRGQGPPHRFARDVARDVGEPDAPPRAVGARRGRDPDPRRGDRADRRGDRRRHRAASSTACSPDAPRTLAVVGPHDEREFPAYSGG